MLLAREPREPLESSSRGTLVNLPVAAFLLCAKCGVSARVTSISSPMPNKCTAVSSQAAQPRGGFVHNTQDTLVHHEWATNSKSCAVYPPASKQVLLLACTKPCQHGLLAQATCHRKRKSSGNIAHSSSVVSTSNKSANDEGGSFFSHLKGNQQNQRQTNDNHKPKRDIDAHPPRHGALTETMCTMMSLGIEKTLPPRIRLFDRDGGIHLRLRFHGPLAPARGSPQDQSSNSSTFLLRDLRSVKSRRHRFAVACVHFYVDIVLHSLRPPTTASRQELPAAAAARTKLEIAIISSSHRHITGGPRVETLDHQGLWARLSPGVLPRRGENGSILQGGTIASQGAVSGRESTLAFLREQSSLF